jgi:phytoene dehydrogenase-like protein
MLKSEYDVVVIGSGPNGLAASIQLQLHGLKVLMIEGRETIGGGMRTKELTLPGFHHDVCSAIHPMAASSPFFSQLPLGDFGLEWIFPEIAAAHPFDDGSALGLFRSIEQTARGLGKDQNTYLDLIGPLVENWEKLVPDILAPLGIPNNPLLFGKFGMKALLPATTLASLFFKEEKTKGFWAGMAAHSILPLSKLTTSAIGLVLLAAGHSKGWPLPKGGSQQLANALAKYFESLGGDIHTGWMIKSMDELPKAKAIVFDTSADQLLKIAGDRLTPSYQKQLKKFRYGMGVFKVDFALNEPIPFSSELVRNAGTVHLGSNVKDIGNSERQSANGHHPESPYVLVAQQSLFDATRAPKGHHTAWAYCHVPNGSTVDMTDRIERQIERYAPGFRDTIIAKHTFDTAQIQAYNPNYVGGDINGGALDLSQLFTRPTVQVTPYRTSTKGIYICSSSTPPGGGVHGMCGYHAANRVIKDLFN